MKDVGHCDKPRVAVNRRLSGDFRMGKPAGANLQHYQPNPYAGKGHQEN
jgi:hypothetical protein